MSHVFPTCLAPRMIIGFRFSSSFHRFNRSSNLRYIFSPPLLTFIPDDSSSARSPCRRIHNPVWNVYTIHTTFYAVFQYFIHIFRHDFFLFQSHFRHDFFLLQSHFRHVFFLFQPHFGHDFFFYRTHCLHDSFKIHYIFRMERPWAGC